MDKFRETISSQEKCLEILANAKWAAGFVCRSCGNEKYCQGKSHFPEGVQDVKEKNRLQQILFSSIVVLHFRLLLK